ncbi:MAG: flagellar type III secretion system pore protein FliP [Bacillota bacterium]
MNRKIVLIFLLFILIATICPENIHAQDLQIPDINLEVSSPEEENQADNLVLSLRILLLLTVLTLTPAIIVMLTSFTRIIIVFSIVKRALAIRNMPPAQVLIGLALFLTVFIMSPVWQDINNNALQPYLEEEITYEEAYNRAENPLRDFMFQQTGEKSLALFVNLSDIERPENKQDIPTYILIPAFVVNEIEIAFKIGFMIYIPFLMIDMIVASILMSMGMLMLPPVIISLPFKILLFVLVDGWYLMIESLIKTFD